MVLHRRNALTISAVLMIAATAHAHQFAWWAPKAAAPPTWDPLDVTSATNQLWLDSGDDDMVTVTGSGVSQLNDKSGNNRNGTQGTDSKRPAYLDPGMNFNGDNLAVTMPTIAQPYTVAIVVSADTYGAQRGVWGPGVLNTGLIFSDTSTGEYPRLSNNNGVNSDTKWGASRTVHVFEINGASTKHWVDGSAATIGNPGTASQQSGTWYLGSVATASLYWDGDLCELLIYSGALSTGDRDDLTDYLMDKW